MEESKQSKLHWLQKGLSLIGAFTLVMMIWILGTAIWMNAHGLLTLEIYSEQPQQTTLAQDPSDMYISPVTSGPNIDDEVTLTADDHSVAGDLKDF